MRPLFARLAALLLFAAGGREAVAVSGPRDTSPSRDVFRSLAAGVRTAAARDLGADPAWGARVVIVDPRAAVLSVQFDAERPTLAQWRTRFPAALAIANGSFYSADERRGEVRPTCDLVLAGRVIRGAGCRRHDALFFGAVPAPDLRPELMPGLPGAGGAPLAGLAADAGVASDPGCAVARSPPGPLLLSPADFHAADWLEALKGFPALVHQCLAACPGPHYCQEHSRTAALAQLRDGKLVLFASQGPAVRREVGRFLAERLGAAEAVNLDGGPEATLSVRGEHPEESIGTPGVGLPLVLVLLARPR